MVTIANDQAEQFYTETIVTDVMAAEEYYNNGGNNVSYGNAAGNNSAAMQQVAAEVEKPAVRIKVSLVESSRQNDFYLCCVFSEQADSGGRVKRGQASSAQCNGGVEGPRGNHRRPHVQV